MNTNIKEIIADHPQVGTILREAGIGCTECTMGTCPLGEIVNVHGLSLEQEADLLAEIASVLFPGEKVEIPLSERPAAAEKSICPPIRKMIDEHSLILRFLDCIPGIIRKIETEGIDRDLVSRSVSFIRGFADGYHHAKEEAVLFSFFEQSGEIVSSFIREHETGRGIVRKIISGLDDGDRGKVVRSFDEYSKLLTEHIDKENSILFPWMNRTLGDSQVGVLFAKCSEIDSQYAAGAAEYEAFVVELERA